MPKYVQLEVHEQEFDVLPLYFWIDRSETKYFRPPLLKSTFLTKKYRKSAILKTHFLDIMKRRSVCFTFDKAQLVSLPSFGNCYSALSLSIPEALYFRKS